MTVLTPPLPPCGLYRTTEAIRTVPAGRLVYFHNHGDPGPGIYLPTGWKHNRAEFGPQGVTLPDNTLAATLEPLPREGFYVVAEPFYCCPKECRRFVSDELVQLGYNGSGEPILFVPEDIGGQLALPSLGTRVDEERLNGLRALKVRKTEPGAQH